MKISHKKEKLLLLLLYCALVAVFWFLKLPCVFRYLFHIPCPGCGMTRAVISALQLDFARAWEYHPMFWSLPFLGAYLLLDEGIFPAKKANRLFLAVIGIGFFVVWVRNLLTFV